MKIKYLDLIEQTYAFPSEEFQVKKNTLYFYGINLSKLVKQYGSPLKIWYLPNISKNIQKAKTLFNNSIKKHQYKGSYHYCYCTKSSHFSFVLKEALKNDIHLETSSAFDLKIIEKLIANNTLSPQKKNHLQWV